MKLFVECDACAAKPGSPVLCAGCLSNRATIQGLVDAIVPIVETAQPHPAKANFMAVHRQLIGEALIALRPAAPNRDSAA